MKYPLVRDLAADGIPVAVEVPGLEDRPPALLPVAGPSRDGSTVGKKPTGSTP